MGIRSTRVRLETGEHHNTSSLDEVDMVIDLKTGNHTLKNNLHNSKKRGKRKWPAKYHGTQTPNVNQNEPNLAQSAQIISVSEPVSPHKSKSLSKSVKKKSQMVFSHKNNKIVPHQISELSSDLTFIGNQPQINNLNH